MDRTRVYYAKQNKSVREKQIPYDFTYMWNLKSKINKQNRNRLRLTDRTDGWSSQGRGFG